MIATVLQLHYYRNWFIVTVDRQRSAAWRRVYEATMPAVVGAFSPTVSCEPCPPTDDNESDNVTQVEIESDPSIRMSAIQQKPKYLRDRKPKQHNEQKFRTGTRIV
jgi:hypothetical protein